MNNLLRIAVFTVKDLMRQKSFFVLLAVAILFVWLLKSCSRADFTVNERALDAVSLAFHASLIAFHAVAAGMFLMTALLSMSIFSRDRDDGSMVMFLSRAVDRRQYVLGRIAGTWVLASVFMFVLHAIIAWTIPLDGGAMAAAYLAASLVCAVNLLFAIVLTCALSLFLPNVMAALFSLILIGVSFVSDGAYRIMHSEMVRQMVSGESPTSLWRIFYPKVYMLQDLAASWITGHAFAAMAPVYVWANVLFYTAALTAVVLWRFYRSEV